MQTKKWHINDFDRKASEICYNLKKCIILTTEADETAYQKQ